MKTIACADMGFTSCPYVAHGDTAEAAALDLKAHGMSAHAEDVQKMMDDGMTDGDMMQKMERMAKEA